jgi:hypothetical protein
MTSSPRSVSWLGRQNWGMTCRDNCIDLMSAVPQTADDLLQRASRQLWAKCGLSQGINLLFADRAGRSVTSVLNFT